MLHLHPAKQAKFLDRLMRKEEEKEVEISLKKTSNFSCQLRKQVLLLHPLRETL